MPLSKRFNLGLVLMIFFILLSACGPSPEEQAATAAAQTAAAATITPTRLPTSTTTPVPPTPTLEPLPGVLPEGIIVTYEGGSTCTLSGPTDLQPGEYAFVLRQPPPKLNQFGIPVGHSLYVYTLVGGKTTQDLLKHGNYKQGTWWSKALDLLVNAKIVDGWRNELRNEQYYTYSLEKGEHVVVRWTQLPHFYWYCGSIFVK